MSVCVSVRMCIYSVMPSVPPLWCRETTFRGWIFSSLGTWLQLGLGLGFWFTSLGGVRRKPGFLDELLTSQTQRGHDDLALFKRNMAFNFPRRPWQGTREPVLSCLMATYLVRLFFFFSFVMDSCFVAQLEFSGMISAHSSFHLLGSSTSLPQPPKVLGL